MPQWRVFVGLSRHADTQDFPLITILRYRDYLSKILLFCCPVSTSLIEYKIRI